MLLVIVDVSNLKRNLLLFTQIRDLGFPVILALNMLDVAEKAGLKINIDELVKDLKVPVVAINAFPTDQPWHLSMTAIAE